MGKDSNIDPKLCLLCRGARYLCGKAYCPIITRTRLWSKAIEMRSSTELLGSSPPSVFVGRIGYPYVYIGPLTPPISGDTSIYDLPEQWSSLPLEDIIDMRMSLILGRTRVMVRDIENRFVSSIHEVVLSLKPVDIEMHLEKPPKGFNLSEFEPPIGPRAPLKEFRVVGSGASSRVIEKFYSDADAKASIAIVELYRSNTPVTVIQRLLSVGALGRKENRRLVPTRWSITAVDDTISKFLIENRIKYYQEIDKIYVFVRSIHKNLFVSILIPGEWSFEWMEAWFPRSTWNMYGDTVVIEGDYELYTANRRDYAAIGGCYYAARLATAEYLERIGRKATAVVLREIYPGFDIPIGVWFVREQLREMYRDKPFVVETIREALNILDRYSVVGSRTWAEKSYIIRKMLKERRIDQFISSR
ncbi:Protein of unknown function DUF650 [Ignisphaera aggregans DSM 17230]|uniref:DNA repair protein n=1 Tax=Ignisphaera aggregans (strain DSM 17230 / JCM 13409 / AQ1.S1) TaxID=583356 RepID=E0SRE8_IGNAA|nr:Protein of unknown function DUF650 [Ignisphaera aggregans DSM 17230]